ncbi:hypothetical protein L1987_33470 [Smallanthus sonchifolius]|uniref:Uncharacterized protein n=1 Tax=Smallanthus sonchifolius TaxID=185202 RepID=A0ACB9HRU2_9ASTR|nr:hypothetical protein L1987_33470 [Smallanthus sonchifolius]
MTTLHSQHKPNFYQFSFYQLVSSAFCPCRDSEFGSCFIESGKNKTAATKKSESGPSEVQGSHPLCSVDIPNSPTPPGATGSGSTANRPSFHHHQETK